MATCYILLQNGDKIEKQSVGFLLLTNCVAHDNATAYIGAGKKKPRRARASEMVASSFPEIDSRAQRMKRNAAIFTILH